jgi:hypothetical protein
MDERVPWRRRLQARTGNPEGSCYADSDRAVTLAVPVVGGPRDGERWTSRDAFVVSGADGSVYRFERDAFVFAGHASWRCECAAIMVPARGERRDVCGICGAHRNA